MRYDESEGPTKVDFGDMDHSVVLREGDIKNGEKASGWTNPLGWADDGTDDEAVVTQLNSEIRMRRGSNHKDAYDGDDNTASLYDAMEKHKKFDWLPAPPANDFHQGKHHHRHHRHHF